ncbi:MAG: hypothetical protein LBL90_05630 [Prevotellaceae bacterium]|jgi:hypothetical protein|nr:hypothetical protein [Prevotellaceae bacterium]
MMNIQDIKQLLDKYFAAETSQEEERKLSAYFSRSDIDSELLPYTSLFRQIVEEKQLTAPANIADKLKEIQQRQHKHKTVYTRYLGISISIAAGLLILLTIGLLHKPAQSNNGIFIMYSNGQRIGDPVTAAEFTNKQLEKLLVSFNKASDLITKPINTVEQSLAPLKKTNEQLTKVEQLLGFNSQQ